MLGRASTALRLGAAAAAPRARTYFSSPLPSLGVSEVRTLLVSPRHRDRKTVPVGTPLTEFEREAAGAARRQGFLWSRHDCGQSAANAHFKHCCTTRTPYIAANRDGSELVVDARPVGGMAKVKRDGAIDSVLAAFQRVLAAAPRAQVVNADSAAAQRERAATSGVDGPNAARVPDTQLGDAFTVHTSGGRDAGLSLAHELAEAYRAALGLPSAAELSERRAALAAERARRKKELAVRALTRLVSDPVAVKNLRVKAGAVDGFVAALKAGTAGVVPPK